MKHHELPLAVALTCSLSGFALAARGASTLHFEHLTVDDGLPENSVRAIVQDAKGFLWFGTHSGLARYDGREMVDRWHSGDEASAPRFMVLALAHDSSEKLWVGSAQHGLWLLDPRTETLSPLSCGQDERWLDGEADVLAVASAADGGAWVGWGGGALCRHDSTGACMGRLPREELAVGQIDALLEDSQGNLWIGSERDGLRLRSFDALSELPTRCSRSDELGPRPSQFDLRSCQRSDLDLDAAGPECIPTQ
jgi:ligand-binding sensor domain-containing protein